MSKKNILITTSVFPYPLNSGGAQAQYHMINALRKKMQISFAYVSTNIKNETALKKEWPDAAAENGTSKAAPLVDENGVEHPKTVIIIKSSALAGSSENTERK